MRVARGVIPVLCLVVGGVVTGVATASGDDQPVWYPTGSDAVSGISGAAAGPDGSVLIVRDNKESDENRVATVTFGADGPSVRELAWQGDLPADLEALDAVPGAAGDYIGLTSAGTGYRFSVDGDTAAVTGTFTVPEPLSDPDYEGFALGVFDGTTVAVWADRGSGDDPATLFAAPFDPATARFGAVERAEFAVPFPEDEPRDVSDLKVFASGRLLITAAADEGDEGPFAGAIYDAVSVSVRDGAVGITVDADPQPAVRIADHKVEALWCGTTATGFLGADDEKLGGAVSQFDFCVP
jgi:hypothetical protein